MRKSEKSGLSQKSSPLDQRGNRSFARLPSDYSPPNLKVRGVNERVELSSFSDYHLTVRPKVDLNRYQVSMLLDVLNHEIVNYGINFTLWLTLEWLFTRLIGSKRVWEVRDTNERRVLLSAELILLTSQGSWLNFSDREKLPEEIRDYLFSNSLIISDRTYQSRSDFWYAERFLEVRAVRMDVFLERESNSIRYSSYTKGYGESSSMGRRQKTRPSAELDGEPVDLEKDQTMSLDLYNISQVLSAVLLELKYSRRD